MLNYVLHVLGFFKGEGGVISNFSSFYCAVFDTAEKDL